MDRLMHQRPIPNKKTEETGSAPAASGSIPIPKMSRGFKSFINDLGREFKKVNWPTKRETNRLSGVVLAVCFFIVIILLLLSSAFDVVVRLITTGKA